MQEEPDDWEAQFFSVYFRAMQCKIAGISSAAKSISNCIDSVMELVVHAKMESHERFLAVNDICRYCDNAATVMTNAAISNYWSIDYSIQYKYKSECIDRVIAAFSIFTVLLNKLVYIFDLSKEELTCAIMFVDDAKRVLSSGSFFWSTTGYSQMEKLIVSLEEDLEEQREKKLSSEREKFWGNHKEEKAK